MVSAYLYRGGSGSPSKGGSVGHGGCISRYVCPFGGPTEPMAGVDLGRGGTSLTERVAPVVCPFYDSGSSVHSGRLLGSSGMGRVCSSINIYF